jgi:hypothetical protein
MKKIFTAGGSIHFLLLLSTCVSAQKHFANGEAVIRGNRLISVKSAIGKQLYHPERNFLKREINIDAELTETDWDQSQIIAPFFKCCR